MGDQATWLRLDIHCAPQNNRPMESSSSDNPVFRGSIPSYAAPDRERWAEDHEEPYEIPNLPEKYLSQARAAVGRDESTLSFNPVPHAHALLDEANKAVATYDMLEGDLDPDTLVYYDPQTDSFWAYPI